MQPVTWRIETSPLMDPQPFDAQPRRSTVVSRAEAWFQRHTDLVALAVIALGLLYRVSIALPSFLNPDEASNVLVAASPTLSTVIQRGIGGPHPVLYIVFLHFWRLLGTSDFMLRLPSILAGTAALWFVFRWLSAVFNRTAGMAGVIMLAFAPTPVALLVEVRQYPFLLMFASAGLLLLELAFQRRSAKAMAFSGLCFILALASHASAVWLLIALGTYGILRLLSERQPVAVTAAWVAGQITIAVLAAYGYLVQFSAIRGSPADLYARENWLRGHYFRPGEDNLFIFTARQTVAFFRYLTGLPAAGVIGATMLPATAGLLFVLGCRGAGGRAQHRTFGLVVLLPFVVACIAAIGRAYPYGGSRHDAVLFLPVAACLGYISSLLTARRILPVLGASALLVPAWIATARPAPDRIHPTNQRRGLIRAAISRIRETVPPDRIIFVDLLSQYMLRHYLCRDAAVATPSPPDEFAEYVCDNFRLVASTRFYTFSEESFGDEFARMVRAYRLHPGDTVQVVSATWGTNIVDRLYRFHKVIYPAATVLGANIGMFKLPVGEEITTADLLHEQQIVGQEFATFLRAMARSPEPRPAAVLLPAELDNDSLRALGSAVAARVVSYREFYQSVRAGQPLVSYLPALALWYLRSSERHPEFMRYMDDWENYMSGGCRFTMLGVNNDSIAGVYLVELAGE
ncbi:MAG: glycosyltransferase family 39 protein [candidate division WOR-3 bacterium]